MNNENNNFNEFLEDFTQISCELCKQTCNQQNCELYKSQCIKRNQWTVEQLIKLGYRKEN